MIQISRSPKPVKDKSLERKTAYDSRPVKRQLVEDFLSKCYLCESKIEGGRFEIDHLKPKGDDAFPEHRFDWENLFFCCPSCNKGRKKEWATPFVKASGEIVHSYPEGGMLDPTKDDVEERLLQILSYEPEPVILFRGRQGEDVQAKNSALELRELHMLRDKSYALRSSIDRQIRKVHELLNVLFQLKDSGKEESDDFVEEKEKLRFLLSREAPYTMLLRSYFKVAPGRLPPFLQEVLES